jgi:carboxylesterase
MPRCCQATAAWTDWVAGANDALTYLRDRTSLPVALVGASMGGLLAIRLACMRPADVAAIVLLAPPLRLKPFE